MKTRVVTNGWNPAGCPLSPGAAAAPGQFHLPCIVLMVDHYIPVDKNPAGTSLLIYTLSEALPIKVQYETVSLVYLIQRVVS